MSNFRAFFWVLVSFAAVSGDSAQAAGRAPTRPRLASWNATIAVDPRLSLTSVGLGFVTTREKEGCGERFISDVSFGGPDAPLETFWSPNHITRSYPMNVRPSGCIQVTVDPNVQEFGECQWQPGMIQIQVRKDGRLFDFFGYPASNLPGYVSRYDHHPERVAEIVPVTRLVCRQNPRGALSCRASNETERSQYSMEASSVYPLAENLSIDFEEGTEPTQAAE